MNLPIGLVAAIPLELEKIVSLLEDSRPAFSKGKLSILKGYLFDVPVYVSISGVGKTNAGVASALLLELFKVKHLVSLGIAGAYPGSGLSPGDVAVATSETYGDEGCLSQDGWLDMKALGHHLAGGNKGRFYNTLPLWAPKVNLWPKGPFLTLSTVTGTREASEALMSRFPEAICETMEGAAVAHVAAMWGVPCSEVRGISNMVGPRDRASWVVNEAAEAAQEAVLKLIESRMLWKEE